MRQNKQ